MQNKIEPIRIELTLNIMFPSVNCYLIPGEQLTLVDCGAGTEENWISLQEQLNQHGYQVKDIDQVIITHEHLDHIGLLPQLLEHSKAIIRVPKMTQAWFANPKETADDYLKFVKKLYATVGFPKSLEEQAYDFISHMRNYPKIDDLQRLEYFEEGDVLEIGNTKWEAMNTPGHCPTQFVFVEESQKSIISGDMLLPIAPMPIVTEDPQNAGHPVRALRNLLDSFERLKVFNFEKVYPGHGPVFSDTNTIIDKQLTRIQMRKAACLEAIQSGLNTPYQIVQKMYPYQTMPPNFSGLHMVLGYVDLLEEEGKVTREANNELSVLT